MTTSLQEYYLLSVHTLSCRVFMFRDERKQLGMYGHHHHNGSEQPHSFQASAHHLLICCHALYWC